MKHINQFITEYIIKKKLDKPIDSEDHYKYFPKTREELTKNIKECFDNKIYNFNCIDTSKITDMSSLFYNKNFKNINFDISDWNVSNVKNMSNMFDGCKCFNCDLSGWNVSNVENMNCMFINCDKFDCDLSNWNVSNVLNMICMFSNCKNFKGIGLDNWNVSKIKTIGGNMMNMLNGCKSIIKEPKWYRFKIK